MSVIEQSDNDVIEAYLDAVWMERGLSENTLTAYRGDLRRFADWLGRRIPARV